MEDQDGGKLPSVAAHVSNKLSLNVASWIFTSRISQMLALAVALAYVWNREKSKEEVNKEWFLALLKMTSLSQCSLY